VIEGQPSRTAQRVALQRAAHQVIDRPPLVLSDPFAIRLISSRAAHELQTNPGRDVRARSRAYVRAIVVARSRLAEDELARAVHDDGVTQYVVLGAGLDTFAYRNPHPSVRVFEVDHPDTQRLKRRRLHESGIVIPDSVRHVPCDFASERWLDALAASGFDAERAAVFAWLGVIMYLPRDAALGTLRDIGSLPSGTSVIFDYLVPPETTPLLLRLYYRRRLRKLASIGEPWTTFFRPLELGRDLTEAGFSRIEDLTSEMINARFFSGRQDHLRVSSIGHVVIARVIR
jgi:methyltransferase (TIGR00027 family)